MAFGALEKTRARNAATMIRMKLSRESCAAPIDIIKYWPQTGVKTGVVASYLPIKTELDPRPLMTALAQAGHELALPCIKRKQHPLEFRRYQLGDKLRGGAYNTREPQRTAVIVTPDVMLVPLLAFSRDGHRLGYGGGFYDRTLAALRSQGQIFACGLAFAGQEVPVLTTDEHDQKLDGVLTENGLRIFT